MTITREQIVRDLAKKTGFYRQDIRKLLSELDSLIKEYYSAVTDDDDVVIQLVEGIKVGCAIQPERERVDPRNRNPIIVKATCKPFAKFSENFREIIQKGYENNKTIEETK